jgi:hypothetical protein
MSLNRAVAVTTLTREAVDGPCVASMTSLMSTTLGEAVR